LFDLPTISTATNGFSENNKIGEGGFGTVYKVIQYLRKKKNYYRNIVLLILCKVSIDGCDYVGNNGQ